MSASLQILAEKDPTVQIVIGVIVAIFWVIAQVAGAISKKKQERGNVPPQLPPEAPMPTRRSPQRSREAPPPRAPQMNRQAPPPRQRSDQMAPPRRPNESPPPIRRPRDTRQEAKQEKLRRQNEQRARALEQMQQQGIAQPPPLVVTERKVATPSIAALASHQTSDNEAVGRADRLRALLRPKNLQKEFIMTEILLPPVSLRPEKEL